MRERKGFPRTEESMKKSVGWILLCFSIVVVLVGCQKPTKETTTYQESQESSIVEAPKKTKIKVGMVTDSGTIEDESFNQGTWEGIKQYKKDSGLIEARYFQPSTESKEEYLQAIKSLVEEYGARIIVTPGFKFEQTIYEAQDIYPYVTFILIDGSPNDGNAENPTYKINKNVASIYFAEEEAGFMAGIAAALSTKNGKLGFIGGTEIEPVQRFGWGYQAGVKYANENYGANAEITNFIFQGSVKDFDAGKMLAKEMFDNGIDIIFTAAGGVGVGAFSEARERTIEGENVYIIGVDVNQYELGLLNTKSKQSVTLTSALKAIDRVTYQIIDDIVNEKFEGGKEYRMTVKNNAIDIPEKNPNLDPAVYNKIQEVKKLMIDGTILVPSTEEKIQEFLAE